MRRLLFLALGCAVWLLVGASSAMADNGIHQEGWGGTPDACAGCHRAHTAKAPYLLKEAQSNLCFACHGSTATGSALDVQDGVGYSGHTREPAAEAGALRGGGFSYARIDSANPSESGSFTTESVEVPVLAAGQASTSTHSVDESGQIAWGNGEINGLEAVAGREIDLSCGNCHDPHGNGMYRILRPTPTDAIAELGYGDHSHDVNIPDGTEHVYTTSNYGHFGDPNDPAFFENVSAWCSNCHTRYLAPHHSAETDSGDAVFAYRHATEYEEGAEWEQGNPGTHRPQCITCHVSHGSNASMTGEALTVTWPNGELPANTADSRLLRLDNRGVCQACHHK